MHKCNGCEHWAATDNVYGFPECQADDKTYRQCVGPDVETVPDSEGCWWVKTEMVSEWSPVRLVKLPAHDTTAKYEICRSWWDEYQNAKVDAKGWVCTDGPRGPNEDWCHPAEWSFLEPPDSS